MALESKIQSKIITQLQKEGWLCVKLIKTNCNGIPDLVCFRNGETKFIEVKQPNGKLSVIQKYRKDEIEKQGFAVHVWTAYNEDFQE
jgi:Holliday junction resolvase